MLRTPLLFVVLAAAGCTASSTDVSPVTAPSPGAWANMGNGLEYGRASYYSDRLTGRTTASGEPYNPGALTAAHRTLPFGTLVDVADRMLATSWSASTTAGRMCGVVSSTCRAAQPPSWGSSEREPRTWWSA